MNLIQCKAHVSAHDKIFSFHKGLNVRQCCLSIQCSYCMNEAQYNCCWNANYCNEVCQQAHWPEHMKDCTQIQQVPKTPGLPANEAPLSTPVSKAPTPHLPNPTPSLGSSVSAGNMTIPESAQTQQQGGYMFVNSSAAAMAAAAVQAAHVQRQGQSVMGGSGSSIPQHVRTLV